MILSKTGNNRITIKDSITTTPSTSIGHRMSYFICFNCRSHTMFAPGTFHSTTRSKTIPDVKEYSENLSASLSNILDLPVWEGSFSLSYNTSGTLC